MLDRAKIYLQKTMDALAGFVDNAELARADAASKVQGVAPVRNNLLVKPKQ